MVDEEGELALADYWRLAAALLYARGSLSAAYAEARRGEALARADRPSADYWSLVQTALMTLQSDDAPPH